ncbi:hypothetical protein [Niabella aurantiaca]|uniref:hypothetical protein n=1 Tax=Niabella aurantiaca TaxID=379900 RepID=UPI00035E1646|nr:hypothetical protein [Niabella aurantiaca]
MAQNIKKTASLAAALLFMATAWGQQTKAFNQNASRSNHTQRSYAANDLQQNGIRTQNNNTVRSNRSEWAAMADLDGDGIYETDLSSRLTNPVTAEGYATVLLGRKTVTVRVIRLKTRHETAKNSIGNIR